VTAAARRMTALITGACVVALAAAGAAYLLRVRGPLGASPGDGPDSNPSTGQFTHHPVKISLPGRPGSYLGVYAKGTPQSYAPVGAFARAARIRPDVVLYYSGWREKFQSAFAMQVKDAGGVPFIQMDPSGVTLSAIVARAYDRYLESFATQVAAYGARTGRGVIIGFGHEMNGGWYPWGYRHASPALFVAAWRHVVDVFRQQGADDVTWLWTVNIIDERGGIPSPAPWWPGRSYVTWVGIDGYYFKSSWTFASLFGPTIKAVRALTTTPIPILISETGVAPMPDKPAKIANLFAGVHRYGLLGFVWFDAAGKRDRRAVSDRSRRRRRFAATIGGAAALAVAAALAGILVFVVQGGPPAAKSVLPGLPATNASPGKPPGYYIGLFQHGAPASYAGITAFTKATGVAPRVVSYYSGWREPFQAGFAGAVARHGAELLVQIDPTDVSLAAIASGRYDSYLRSYADAVRSYGHALILGFGHEMNGNWYSWGYRHTSPGVFVAAWRHIVDVFREQGAGNVTWMWTVNVVHRGNAPSPARWWPGRSYVDWVGIDGYYDKRSWTFAPLFGPTIKIVRALTTTPIPVLISETGAPAAYQPAKIPDLFRGVRAYGLLGFVWFNAHGVELSAPSGTAAFRRAARAAGDPAP
jgi:mannan endo-1,4-beta-mannosidase